MKWFLFAVAAIALFAVLLLFTGFADVPCQDGRWDGSKQTCVHY